MRTEKRRGKAEGNGGDFVRKRLGKIRPPGMSIWLTGPHPDLNSNAERLVSLLLLLDVNFHPLAIHYTHDFILEGQKVKYVTFGRPYLHIK